VQPIIVDFPLRGEWVTPNTPGFCVPSHGTDQLGQSYAYDIMQIDWRYPAKSFRFFTKPMWSAVIFGVPLNQTLCWSQPVFAPFDGEVVEVADGIKERDPVHVLRDLAVVLKNGLLFRAQSNRDLNHLLGNYIILQGENYFAMFAHFKTGSIRVKPGDRVICGDKIAEVGHSGNSTAPHLHFQLMDRPELLSAKGLPCCFREYELFEDNQWQRKTDAIPGRFDRIRRI